MRGPPGVWEEFLQAIRRMIQEARHEGGNERHAGTARLRLTVEHEFVCVVVESNYLEATEERIAKEVIPTVILRSTCIKPTDVIVVIVILEGMI